MTVGGTMGLEIPKVTLTVEAEVIKAPVAESEEE